MKKAKEKKIKEKKVRKIVYVLQNGKQLDRKAFLRYFEKKVLYTIRKFKLLEKSDVIAVACSGGKDSNVLLYCLAQFCKQRKQKLFALAIDEGISGYRDKLLSKLRKFCKKLGVTLKVYSFKKEFGFTLQQITRKIAAAGLTNCYVCSILKRWLLNKKARELKCTKIVTGHSLDDEAETIIENMFKGNAEMLARLGPVTGVASQKGFVQRVKPLYLCSGEEIVLYARLKNIPASAVICPLRGSTIRVEIRNFLNKMQCKHHEIKNAIVKCYLELAPILKKAYAAKGAGICRICKEPAAEKVCKRCQILELLKKQKTKRAS